MAQDHQSKIQNGSNQFVRQATDADEQESHSHPPSSQAVFSIATPAVTTILPMTEDLNDTSFMLTASSYHHQEGTILDCNLHPQDRVKQETSISVKDKQALEKEEQHLDDAELKVSPPQLAVMEAIETEPSLLDKQTIEVSDSAARDSYPSELDSVDLVKTLNSQDDNRATDKIDISGVGNGLGKKRTKMTKKNTKLDAKSKLEKSRQSARECRARKKLRYQYLEDLVCNREKAVVKLREELATVSKLDYPILIVSTIYKLTHGFLFIFHFLCSL